VAEEAARKLVVFLYSLQIHLQMSILHVLVKVYEVNLCSDNQCQNKVNLFTNQQGLEVDLSKLNGILQYINTANIPQGTYNRLEVILDKNLTIIDGSGVYHPAIFYAHARKT